MNSICFKTCCTLCVLLGLLTACEPDNSSVVGEDWIYNGTKVFYIDTFTVNTSTYKFDSISVSDTDRLLVGAYMDNDFGRITAKPYIQLYSSNLYADSDAVFDSVALILKYDSYFYNDTIPKQKFKAYEVIKNIKVTEDYYYNTSNYNTNDIPIGEIEASITPRKVDSLHFTLNPAYGRKLFEDIQNNEFSDINQFLAKYKGLMITPDSSNTTVFGFEKSSKLRLYYTIKEEVESDEAEYIDLDFSTANSFHNLSSNYNNTYFENLNSQKESISSAQTNNTSFIQSGSGLATKIDIPYIEQVYNITGSGSVMNAQLYIALKRNSSTTNLHTRDSLNVYIIDQRSETISVLTDHSGNQIYALKNSSQSELSNTVYTIDLQYFVDLKLNSDNRENLFLSLSSQDFNESVDRYILEGQTSETNALKTTLALYYALYDDDDE
ncbi:DUF4270 family protein [Formosa sp. A9]|uniref:DUF4270 family protein n=1 Tax=Formosa sp. A9 TaxID=3442641 RepID=UPI003EBC152B